MIKFNKQQIVAAKYPAEPLLIIAGAGTGKTTTVVGRMAFLIQEMAASPESILALTFTNEAANNLKKQLEKEIGDDGNLIQACTFHSFAQMQTNKYYNLLGYDKPPLLINRGDIYFLLRQKFDLLKRLHSANFRRNPILAVQSFAKVFDAFRQNLLGKHELIQLQQKEKEKILSKTYDKTNEPKYQLIDIVNTFPQYLQWKLKRNWIDYGDMISNLWTLIQDHKPVLDELQSSYEHVIVDEFQDNNYALSKIVQKIAAPQNSITVVGDDDQCIYAFRQANIQNVHQFSDRYYVNKKKPVELIQNYRSVQGILNLANWIIEQNSDRLPKSRLISDKKSSALPVLYIGSETQQLEQLVEMAQSLVAEKNENPSDIAVLLRTHNKCKTVSDFFKNKGIHTHYHADKLYEQPVVKDIIALLNIWASTTLGEHGFLRILNRNYSKKLLLNLTWRYKASSKKMGVIDFAQSQSGVIQEATDEILSRLKNIDNSSTVKLIWGIFQHFNLYRKYAYRKTYSNSLAHHSMNCFWKIVIGYCRTYGYDNPKDFVQFINVQWEVNDEPLPAMEALMHIPAIRIMTVHAAKGMEFKHVFLPLLSSAGFPLNFKPMQQIDRLPITWQRWNVEGKVEKELHYEEERRLFYVAITRAMESLTLMTPDKRQSIFIKDIDNTLIKKERIIMEEKQLTVYDTLILKYQSILNAELNMENYDTAKEILSTIENIQKLKRGNNPEWENDELEKDVLRYLNNNDRCADLDKVNLSATSINTYHDCPLKYKYRYIDQIPGAPEPSHFKLGHVVHKVLELYHQKEYSNLDDMLALLDDNWEEGGYQFNQEKEQYREDAEIMLKNYYHFIQKNPEMTLEVEKTFHFETDYAKLHGKCDRIDMDSEGRISIIDYKTSKSMKSKRELKKDVQMGIYALYAVLHGIDMHNGERVQQNPSKLSNIFVRFEDPEVAVQLSEEELDVFEENIRNTADEIAKRKFEANKGRHCEFCDYKNLICPEFG